MSTSGKTTAAGPYEIGVAIAPMGRGAGIVPDPRPGHVMSSVPGYEDVRGTGRTTFLIGKGDDAVNAATEAIATQIGRSAQRIAKVVSSQMTAEPSPEIGLESVEVSFGIALTAGLQTIFTAQTESSVQVTIKLSRPDPSSSTTPGQPQQ